MNKFGNSIRKLRERKKITLRDLADRSNLSYSFIASLEKGRYNPSRKSIYSLAGPLDADLNELLMLAGFLPEQSEAIEQQTGTEPFALEDIMKMAVTFQGIELNEADKIALIAFSKTISSMKNSE